MNYSILQEESVPDNVLVKNILSGERRQFELIIRRYNKRLYRIGMSILNDDTEVEDAMQVSYVKAFEHLIDFEHRSSFGTWLTRIMLNECLAQKNKNKRLRIMEEEHHPNVKNLTTPAHLLLNKELGGILEQAIADLPEKYRTVFVLREVEDLSIRETAAVLMLEESNIKVRLNRAKTMLRGYLNGYLKENVYAFHLSRCDKMVDQVFKAMQTDYPSDQAWPGGI
jgi:RNA polymerase sigma factor (sigma-70 family)